MTRAKDTGRLGAAFGQQSYRGYLIVPYAFGLPGAMVVKDGTKIYANDGPDAVEACRKAVDSLV